MASRASSNQRLEPLRHVEAGVLEIAYYEAGPQDGPVAVLLHGYPYDIHSYVDVAPMLAANGVRVIVPYLRGYGETRFLSSATPRSGEQAAIGADLIALMDALAIRRAVFAGYDWGGRAACVGAALWPERCAGLVSVNSYLIQDIANALVPVRPEREVALWYQWYFQIERGRAGLAANHRAITKILWRQWSPNWTFDVEQMMSKIQVVLEKCRGLIQQSRLEIPGMAGAKGLVEENYSVKTGLSKAKATPGHIKDQIVDKLEDWFGNPKKPPAVDKSRIVGISSDKWRGV